MPGHRGARRVSRKVQLCRLYFMRRFAVFRSRICNEVAHIMELIQLEDRLRLNIPEIDLQHEKLIALVNRLRAALVDGAEKAARDSLLSQLLEGMRNHCAYEEQLMTEYGYPGYEAHKSEHDRLAHNLGDLIERYRNGELVLSIAVVMELNCWAKIHIEKSDMPLGVFLLEQKGFAAARN